MSAQSTSFAIRYRVQGRTEVVFPKTHLSRESARVQIGRIIDRAHQLGHTLEYVHVVACVKRPGTRVIADISRMSMTQSQLVRACNAYHRLAAAASC